MDATALKQRTRRPSPGRPTRQQAEARNEELLDKALDMFVDQGFERTSIEGITAAVGMAKRTVYARYGDKETLFRAALQRAIDDWLLPVERLQELESDDFEASLLAMGRLLVDNITSEAGMRLMRLTNAESSRIPNLGDYTLRKGTGPTVAYLTDLLRRNLPERFSGPGDDAEVLAYAFLHLVAGGPANIMAWGVPLTREQIEAQTVHGVRLFLHGVLH